MKALIKIIDADGTELAHLYAEGEFLKDVLGIVEVLVGYIPDMPASYDIKIQIDG